MKLSLKNGETKEYESSLTCKDVIHSIGENLLRSAVCARVNGKIVDLSYTINEDCSFEIITLKDKTGLRVLRHTAAHILSQALKTIYPTCKLAANGITDNGFFCDADFNTPITEEDLEKIEVEMRKIARSNFAIERFTLPRLDAVKLMTRYSERYKVRYIKDLPEDCEISFYKHGSFVDLCKGPHMPSTGKLKAFRLSSVSGAYWRGNDRNKMLTRIYGVAFTKKDEVETHFKRIEEGKNYDHRKLGKELNLFSMLSEGKGAPFFMPKGARLKNALIEYWRSIQLKSGYLEVSTPPMISKSHLENSGAWDIYKGEIFTAKINGDNFAVKPINGLGSLLVYNQTTHGYKDLPVRMSELDVVYRKLKSGRVHGLMRTRSFTQDDGCVILQPNQIKEELMRCVKSTVEVYQNFSLDFEAEISSCDDTVIFENKTVTQLYREVLKELGITYVLKDSDNFFKSSNLSFFLKDAVGRKWRCGSILVDNNAHEKYGISYTAEDNSIASPVIIHNTVFGSLERFLGILIERFQGNFPVWLAPVQVRVLTVTDDAVAYAKEIGQELLSNGIRIEQDFENNRISKKIRDAQIQHIPYMLIIGKNEKGNQTVFVRNRVVGIVGEMKIQDFIDGILKEIKDRTIF